MKLKSMFLTALAAMALASCSNENDPVNGDLGEKDARFNFCISLPAGLATRGIAADNPDKNEGAAEEYGVSSIKIVLDYGGSSLSFNYTDMSKFNQVSTTGVNGDYVYRYELITPELVNAGQATVKAYVNGQDTETVTTASGFLTTYAEDNNFLMAGQEDYNIVAGEINGQTSSTNGELVIKVDRVAVKLDEITEETSFAATNTGEDKLTDLDLKFTLEKVTFSNLPKQANVLPDAGFIADNGGYFNAFNQTLLKYNVWGGDVLTDEDGMAWADRKPVYCFENNSTTDVTFVWYKAKISKVVDGVETAFAEGTDLYLRDKVIYEGYEALAASFGENGKKLLEETYQLSAASSNEDFMKAINVKKYTNAYCYYGTEVDPAAKNIVRNNWYKLKVTGIKDLGGPEVDYAPGENPTLLVFAVEINPWKVWVNDITLE